MASPRYIAHLFPGLSLVVVAADWLLGTEPTRECQGKLIDGACLGRHNRELDRYLAKHSKECLLSPDHRTSGMFLVRRDGRVMAFDKRSGERLVRFMEGSDCSTDVVVRAEKRLDGTFRLVSVAARG